MKSGKDMPSRRFLCIAEAFGFGPASKLCTLVRWLGLTNGEATFLGHRCAFEFCQTGPFHRFADASPCDLSPQSALQREIDRHDVLVTAMEFAPITAAKEAGLKTIVVDSLFWMWPDMPCNLDSVDLYLCQNFLGVPERRAGLERENVVIIPPLTYSERSAPNRSGSVVLNFGGLDNPVASLEQQLEYATCLLGVVRSACREADIRLEVYGGKHVIDILRQREESDETVFDSLPLPRFLARVTQARALITSPGLETIYEAFTLGVPVFLLPPQNNSQAYQARLLQQELPLLPGPQYPDLLGTPALRFDLEPSAAIREVLARVGRLRDDPDVLTRLRESVLRFLGQDTDSARLQREAQDRFMSLMRTGADVTDVRQIRSLFEQTLAN